MYSDRYHYYNIQFDPDFKQGLENAFVSQCILETGLFVQKDRSSFTSIEGFPWTETTLAQTSDGNYSGLDLQNSEITLVAIVCSKGEEIDQQTYITTFRKIADQLGWKLYLEEDDDGNENVEL